MEKRVLCALLPSRTSVWSRGNTLLLFNMDCSSSRFFRLKKLEGRTPVSKVELKTLFDPERPHYTKLFYDWNDMNYQKFMVELCTLIEPRFEK